jgi:hypothetical protein
MSGPQSFGGGCAVICESDRVVYLLDTPHPAVYDIGDAKMSRPSARDPKRAVMEGIALLLFIKNNSVKSGSGSFRRVVKILTSIGVRLKFLS